MAHSPELLSFIFRNFNKCINDLNLVFKILNLTHFLNMPPYSERISFFTLHHGHILEYDSPVILFFWEFLES